MEFSEAVDAAVKSCIEDGVLADYLRARRAEVKDMFMTEYDEEQAYKWYEEKGMKEGREEAIVSSTEKLKRTLGLGTDAAMDALEIPEGERGRYYEKLS